MIKIHDLEKAVSELPRDDLKKFRVWFETFDAKQWDQQFEYDVADGKLNRVAEQAIVSIYK